MHSDLTRSLQDSKFQVCGWQELITVVTNFCLLIAPPAWVIRPSDTEVAEGSDVIVECRADGDPIPNISWKKLTGMWFLVAVTIFSHRFILMQELRQEKSAIQKYFRSRTFIKKMQEAILVPHQMALGQIWK